MNQIILRYVSNQSYMKRIILGLFEPVSSTKQFSAQKILQREKTKKKMPVGQPWAWQTAASTVTCQSQLHHLFLPSQMPLLIHELLWPPYSSMRLPCLSFFRRTLAARSFSTSTPPLSPSSCSFPSFATVSLSSPAPYVVTVTLNRPEKLNAMNKVTFFMS
jgi:hypothetical protein